jgi:hypothetical protein
MRKHLVDAGVLGKQFEKGLVGTERLINDILTKLETTQDKENVMKYQSILEVLTEIKKEYFEGLEELTNMVSK